MTRVANPSWSGLFEIFKTLVNFALEAVVVFTGVGYVFRVLGVYFEDTNERLSNMFHFLADVSGLFKALKVAVFKLGKPLKEGAKGFKAIDDAAGPLTRKLQEIENIFPGLRRMLPKNNPLRTGLKAIDDVLQNIVKTAKAAAESLKSIPGVKQVLGLRDKLRDPRSAGQIRQSEFAKARNKLGGFKKTAGETMESLGIPKLAKGGVVTAPTFSLVGEEGAEAVIPLTSTVLNRIGEGITINQPDNRAKSSDTVINVNLGDINITGDNQDSASIKRMMERELPKIISRSVRSGASGTI